VAPEAHRICVPARPVDHAKTAADGGKVDAIGQRKRLGRVLLPLDPGAAERPDLLWLSNRYLRETGSGGKDNAD